MKPINQSFTEVITLVGAATMHRTWFQKLALGLVLTFVIGVRSNEFGCYVCPSAQQSVVCHPKNLPPPCSAARPCKTDVCNNKLGEGICDEIGIFPLASSPKKYLVCIFSDKTMTIESIVEECLPDSIFCPETLRCMSADEKDFLMEYYPQINQTNAISCENPGIYPDPKSCKKYHVCGPDQYKSQEHTCPRGTYFSALEGQCVTHLTAHCANQLLQQFNERLIKARNLYQLIRFVRDKRKNGLKNYGKVSSLNVPSINSGQQNFYESFKSSKKLGKRETNDKQKVVRKNSVHPLGVTVHPDNGDTTISKEPTATTKHTTVTTVPTTKTTKHTTITTVPTTKTTKHTTITTVPTTKTTKHTTITTVPTTKTTKHTTITTVPTTKTTKHTTITTKGTTKPTTTTKRTTTTTTTTTTTKKPDPTFVCPCIGSYPDPLDCHKYYNCIIVNLFPLVIKPFHHTCPPRTRFYAELTICLHYGWDKC